MCIGGLLSFILPGKRCLLSLCGLNPCFIQRHLHQLQLLPEFAPVPRASGTANETMSYIIFTLLLPATFKIRS